jgi:hypothetical protein
MNDRDLKKQLGVEPNETMNPEAIAHDIAQTRGHCGECLMNDVEIVPLDASGKCPRCGADYGQP